MNKQMVILFLLLTGCGSGAKSQQAGAATTAQTQGQAQCQAITGGQAATLYFSGNDEDDPSKDFRNEIMHYAAATDQSVLSGQHYWRDLQSGTTIDLYLNGAVAMVVMNLSAQDTQMLEDNGNTQVCYMTISESLFSSPISGGGFSGTIAGGQLYLNGISGPIVFNGTRSYINF